MVTMLIRSIVVVVDWIGASRSERFTLLALLIEAVAALSSILLVQVVTKGDNVVTGWRFILLVQT